MAIPRNVFFFFFYDECWNTFVNHRRVNFARILPHVCMYVTVHDGGNMQRHVCPRITAEFSWLTVCWSNIIRRQHVSRTISISVPSRVTVIGHWRLPPLLSTIPCRRKPNYWERIDPGVIHPRKIWGGGGNPLVQPIKNQTIICYKHLGPLIFHRIIEFVC